MRASSELQFGALREVWRHARGREYCRGKPDSALPGGYAPGSAKAEGSSIVDKPGMNPCARESKARTRRFLREKLMSDHGLFSSYEGHKERRTGKICGASSRMRTGLWTPGCWLVRGIYQLKVSTTMDLGISIFLISVRCVALRNLNLLTKLIGA